MRLGLDIGTNSIGWWLYELQDGRPHRVMDGGVRIFSDGRDPKSNASLAVDRRMARAMRRRRDRYLRRRAALMKRLASAGLMPSDQVEAKALAALDPYELRATGLYKSLDLTKLGRALFHLNQRRGFKSNRKTDRGDNEAGKIAQGAARLDQAMMAAGARTYGEFLHKRRASATDLRRTPAVRTRLTLRRDEEADKEVAAYDFYPTRAHLETEFQKLWEAQTPHHPAVLTDELRDALFEIIFYQRPLKAPKVGRCLFVDEPRLPKAHPLTQRRVLYETVNNLRIRKPGAPDRSLTRDERDALLLKLDSKSVKAPSGANVTFTQLGKILKLSPDEKFSLETENRKGIACDALRAMLGHKDRFGPRWSGLSEDAQWDLVQKLQDTENPDELLDWLKAEHGLEGERALEVANAPLPEGYSRLGLTATRKILERLKADVITYDRAASDAYGHHSDHRTGEALDYLPYYGAILDRYVIPGSSDPADPDVERYGRITNPTVHIGLNQLRRLINRIIDRYGRPDEIVVELARELKQNEAQKKDWNTAINRNTAAAMNRSKKLIELGQRDTGANRMILRLWEELGEDPMNRRCPYTGQSISCSMLFDGSCDVDHILPYSRTLDDSIANRTLCLREANREKRNQTPWECWGGTARWPAIEANLNNLPDNKRWRFAPDAMERFEENRDFVDRQLVDTQYLSRIAREYLSRLYPDRGTAPVWVTPGRLTEMLRRHWGLNSLLPDHNQVATAKKKNRLDHRHHAIDAAVIGATDRGLLHKISKEAGRREQDGLDDVIADVPPPWEGFRADLEAQLDKIVVSHRADHGRVDPAAKLMGKDVTTGQLHNDTAYGLTDAVNSDGVPVVVTRKPLDSVTPKMIAKVRDPHLQDALQDATLGKEGKDFEAALRKFAARPGPYQGIRRVRVEEPLNTIPIRDAKGKAFKGYKPDSNQFYEVWRLTDGVFIHHVTSTFEAHQGASPRPHPAAKRVMRLHKGDMLKLEKSKFGPVYATVEKFDANGGISLTPHTESNADQRYRKKIDDVFIRLTAASLMKSGGRRVFVDETGRVRDAGPHHLRQAKRGAP